MEIQLTKPGEFRERNIKDHFHFVGKKVTDKEIDSFLPFFNCDEIGHEEMMLDQVCLEGTCTRRGLTCVRCVHLRHSNHPQRVVSLRSFVSDLLKSQTDKKEVLNAQQLSCSKYRDCLISMAKDFVDNLIDHFSIFVAAVHKYYSIFENEFEDNMIKSDVIIHKLIHKQHVRRDHFAEYISTTISALSEGSQKKEIVLKDYEKAFRISNEFQTDILDITKHVKVLLQQHEESLQTSIDLHRLSSKVPEFDVTTLALQHKFKRDFRTRLQDVFAANEKNMPGLSSLAGKAYTQASDGLYSRPPDKQFAPGDDFQIKFGGGKQSLLEQLEMLRPTLLETQQKRPHRDPFRKLVGSVSEINSQDAVDLFVQQKYKIDGLSINNQTAINGINGLNGINGNNQYGGVQSRSEKISIMPGISEYLQGGEYYACGVDSSRRKCMLGRAFKSVTNGSIVKLTAVKTSLKDISCICVISEDIVAVAGRFSGLIEFYRIQDKQIVGKIETSVVQGVKSMCLIRKEQDDLAEWQPILVVGTYSDEKTILSYRVDVLRKFADRQEPISISIKTFRTFEKHTNEAVMCMAQLYLNEFFIVGYSSGSLAIFSTEGSTPINVLPNLYDSPVTNVFTVQEGKFFLSASKQKIRFHIIKSLSHIRVEQEVTAFYIGTQNINCLMMTNAFNQEESYLKFQHLLCGDLRFDDKEDYKEGAVRVLRTAQNNIRLTEESILPIFNEAPNNSIKEMVLIEPRKKQRIVWLVTFGGEHHIKLWELKSGYTETLKLWEKGVTDFLLQKGTSVIKSKLLYESVEFTSLKWSDIQSKVQILSAYENNNTGKIIIKFAVVNHASKSDIDLFELQMVVNYQ